MKPKPRHLGSEYAEQFRDRTVVEAYPLRPPYPLEAFGILVELVSSESRRVLDVGCGTGDLSRAMAPLVDHVDAVDASGPMIRRGRSLLGADHEHLTWIHGTAETAPLAPPYGLVMAGESLHWMEWKDVMPRLRDALVPDGLVVILEREILPGPWEDELRSDLIPRYSTNKDYEPYDLVEELTVRGLFACKGAHTTDPVSFVPTMDDYVEVFHSRNGFSRDRMTVEDAEAFDHALAHLVSPFARSGQLDLEVVAHITWGLPAPQ